MRDGQSKSPPVPRTNTDPIGWASRDTRNERVPDPRDAQLAALRVELAAVTEQREHVTRCWNDTLRTQSAAVVERDQLRAQLAERKRYIGLGWESIIEENTSLRAQLAAVTTAMTEYRAHLLDEIQNGHGANREAYQRVLDWLAALMEGTTE